MKPSIVAVIGERVHLRRTGKNYTGLCPFHAEKHPSLSVNENKGLFHCFGCGASGDVITFIELIEKTDFKGALKILGLDDGDYKPRPRKDTRTNRAAALLAGWMNEQHLKVGALLRELSQQIALADEISDRELKESLERKWEILSDLYGDLQNPRLAGELWKFRETIENLTADVEPKAPEEFPEWTPEYAAYIAEHLPEAEVQACH